MNKHALSAAVLSLLSIAGHAQTPTFRTETTVVQLPVRVPGRLYVFLLDDAHVGVGHSARARDLIKGFIRDRVMPADAAAVVIASGAARQDFTRDKAALLRAVDRFTGTLDMGEPARAQETRARGIVKLVTDLAGALGNTRRHKTLVYIGSQVGCRVGNETTTDFYPKLKGQQQNPDDAKRITEDADEQILCNDQLWDAVRAAVQANVSLYAIDPRGMLTRGWVSPSIDGRGGPDPARRRMLMAEAGRPSVLDGFHVLADHTGGFAVTDTNNYRGPFDRIVRESSTYYLLAYTSTNNKVDGKYRRTQVNMKREGVKAFYRSGYMARRP